MRSEKRPDIPTPKDVMPPKKVLFSSENGSVDSGSGEPSSPGGVVFDITGAKVIFSNGPSHNTEVPPSSNRAGGMCDYSVEEKLPNGRRKNQDDVSLLQGGQHWYR